MAGGAADCAKEPAAVSDRGRSARRSSGGCGLVEELHERNEQPNVTGHCGSAGTTRVGNVLRVADPRQVQAIGGKPASQLVLTRQRPVLRKQFVGDRSEEHTSELQSRLHLVCRLLLEKKKNIKATTHAATSAS